MAEISSYPSRLPKSLKEKVAIVAKRDGSSMNQFITVTLAEKVSALETEKYFANRIKESDINAFRSLLFRSGGEPPRVGDELPDCATGANQMLKF
ncbi:MAG: toxin-antitoxin system HicB family antitoxin [Gammaproteobacteria bacterium]|nr:toxin-antitoxin system HicB family antitoxin [Gammaproteobacteria bacterium]